MITATGLGSGLDINGLVSQLVAAERAGSDLQLNREGSRISVELSAFSQLQSSLSSFKSALSGIASLDTFEGKSVSSSDTEAITVTAQSTAVNNSYDIEVSQLAKNHSLNSIAFADSDSTAIGTGSITIRFGTTDYESGTDTYNSFTLNPESSTATIAIDSSNNTLDGIMGAINDADIGVNASVVNDGSGFRLLLTSTETGLENSLEIAVDDDDLDDSDTSGLSRLAFNASATNLEQSAAASDALLTVNGLAVSSASNTVDEVIPGASLTLKSLTTSPVAIDISDDNTAVINAVLGFVAGYNQFQTLENSLTSYDAENQVAGFLQGDFTVRAITGQIDNIVRNDISGLGGDFTNLAELGITTSEIGHLELDQVKLQEVLASNKDDVIKIFTAFAAPDDEDIAFQSASSATVVGDYAVEITQLATAGAFTGSGVLPDFGGGGTLTIDADNDALTVEVDGVDTGSITLTNGVYTTGDDLASEIQAQINGTTAMRDADKTVSVTYDSGTDSFTITSSTLGNASTVNILAVDTNTAAELGFSVTSGTDGLDVAGTIGGVAATGAGNLLTGAEGSDTEGLNLVIGGSTTGSRGNVSFTRGLASQLDAYLDAILDVEEGTVESRINTLEEQQVDLEDRREELELKWEVIEERYLRQFNALDSLLSQLETTSSFLETSLASLPKPNSIRSNN